MKPGSIVVGPCMWPGCDGTAYVHARGVQPRGLYFCDAHRTKARDHGTYKRACVPPAEPGALCVRGCGRPQAAIQPAKYDSVPAALRACCLPSAVVRVLGPEGLKEMDLEAFWRPREALLTSGRLVAFHEWPLEELAGQVWVDGDLASARVRYAKAGWLDGAPWEGAGFKHFQMVRMTDGWRIASLAWQDDA